MNQGDVIQIKGWLGFTKDATFEVKEINGQLVCLKLQARSEGGLLSHLNESWHDKRDIELRML